MFVLHTDQEIDAPPAAVWAELTDLEHWPEWHPSIVSIAAEGPLAPGTRLRFVGRRDDAGRTMRFRPVLRAVDEARELRWLGTLGVPGLFDGEHRFVLEPLPGGRTRFVQEERFRGLLVPLLRRMLERDTLPQFRAANAALAARAARARGAI